MSEFELLQGRDPTGRDRYRAIGRFRTDGLAPEIASAAHLRLARPAPTHTGPVDILDRLVDPVLAAELVHGAAALGDEAIVVDDRDATCREPGVQRFKRQPVDS